MSEALLFVLSEPGGVPEPTFHEWYDDEHGPARLAVPGIRIGYRYRALDDARPTWLAWYETDLETLAGARYRALREWRSPREQRIVDGLDALDRRVYKLIDDHGRIPGPAPVVVCTSFSTPDEDALHAWYLDEHIPMLQAIPGWWRTRRYRIVSGTGPTLLAFHELSGTHLFDTDAYRAAVSTIPRSTALSAVTARERRVFGYHNTIRSA